MAKILCEERVVEYTKEFKVEVDLVGMAAKLFRRKASPERQYLKYPNLKLNMPWPSKINQQRVGVITY